MSNCLKYIFFKLMSVDLNVYQNFKCSIFLIKKSSLIVHLLLQHSWDWGFENKHSAVCKINCLKINILKASSSFAVVCTWSIYIMNSVDKTKLSWDTPLPLLMQHQFLYKLNSSLFNLINPLQPKSAIWHRMPLHA